MRIGVMLRAMDEKQGIGIYSQNLMDELLAMDRENEYVLFYRNPAFLGRYAPRHSHVREVLLRASSKAVWDQVKVPAAARREGVDVIFHTKFTVPFLTGRKTAMTIHGASWFVHPELYPRLDVAYVRTVMPLYCRKADAIFSNSELTADDFVRILRVPREKIHVTRLGTSRSFRVISDDGELRRAREKFGLPEKFILSVIKYHPLKNFGNLIAAFRLLRKRVPCKLVVAGRGCDRFIEEHGLRADGTLEDVTFLGWTDPADLPALYNLARCLFAPSVYEEFGIPACEAMACGCPPVVSNTGAFPGNVGEAGILVDPRDPAGMADALERMWSDDGWRAEHVRRSLLRAREFTWERCARETLAVLRRL